MNALYLCYQSLLEPLTQTQVVPYLEGLVQAGYGIVLLSFEPRALAPAQTRKWQRRLAAKGVTWHWRRYHKRPTVPATAWDVIMGVFTGLRLMRRHHVCLLHARCHVPGVMALILKQLTGARLLFDLRGLMAEEYADAGVWRPNGTLFRLTKRVERALVKAADGMVILTERARELLFRWYPEEIADKPVVVIPCCVDLRHSPADQVPGDRAAADQGKTLVYVGKLDGWYLTEAMAGFMVTAIRMIPGLRWKVWTQSDPRRLRRLLADQGINGEVAVGSIPADAVPAELAGSHAGLSFRKPGLSALAASPAKIGEYLAAGLPVIANPGIGDTDALLAGHDGKARAPVGVTVREFSEEAYREAVLQLAPLLSDPDTPGRCRRVAEEHLDLRRVGWTRYRQVYDALIGRGKDA